FISGYIGCNHGLIALRMTANIEHLKIINVNNCINNNDINQKLCVGYMEKDWENTFPKSYIWIQCKPEKWINYREDLSNFLEYTNLEPIYSKLVLIDKLLEDFPNDQKKKTETFYQKKEKRSRNVKFAKNLLTATRKLENDELRKNFFNRAKFTMSILTDKNITPIIDEFKELFKDFQKI
ncbi:41_t:CDS:2, partial [Gigaspora margarita]